MRWLFFLLYLCGSLFVSQGFAADKRDYQLGAGDVVRITVYDHPDLTADARISEAGSIQFPLLGDVVVRGRTTAEAAEQLAALLDRGGFVKKPQVTIMVAQYRSQQISLLGFVSRPGKYTIEQASTVLDLLAQAGGVAPIAGDTAILMRATDPAHTRRELDLTALFENGDPAHNPEVSNGDVIYVPREPRYYIYGEIQRAGTYRIERDMTVVQALSVAGGLSLRGTERRVKVRRRDAAGEFQLISVKLDDKVRPNDVIHVTESLF